MLTKEQVLNEIKNGKKSECVDSRDYGRLTKFFNCCEWEHFGFKIKKGTKPPQPKEWTKEKIIEQLKSDVTFGFEKALDQRGISASFMNEVIRMWMWVLEDDLQSDNDYAQYGLPLLKKVAVKYGFENEIGDDYGNENKYASD